MTARSDPHRPAPPLSTAQGRLPRDTTEWIAIAGRDIRFTHPGKVIYPETGTTKADVLAYYLGIAEQLLPLTRWRPATRKRWPDGVGTPSQPGASFFQKNLDAHTPDWIPRVRLHQRTRDITYPMVQDSATLAWLAQTETLEVHVSQWRVTPDGTPLHPDRLVVDLDPGAGAGLPECVEVAMLVRRRLLDLGLDPVPVTSGSTGIHVYAHLDGTRPAPVIAAMARDAATALAADHPDLVTASIRTAERVGKVLIDWSQNSAAKTTAAPYSLRGRDRPTVACPRTWEELADPQLGQVEYSEVAALLARRADPAARLACAVEPGPP